mmetsp:Transcript_84249/g.164910  ORF Transcript_84249/g.164910 Transcript_84249/m.164910 type:complete len:222 (-) Transcript_84249:340-1005(-)
MLLGHPQQVHVAEEAMRIFGGDRLRQQMRLAEVALESRNDDSRPLARSRVAPATNARPELHATPSVNGVAARAAHGRGAVLAVALLTMRGATPRLGAILAHRSAPLHGQVSRRQSTSARQVPCQLLGCNEGALHSAGNDKALSRPFLEGPYAAPCVALAQPRASVHRRRLHLLHHLARPKVGAQLCAVARLLPRRLHHPFAQGLARPRHSVGVIRIDARRA